MALAYGQIEQYREKGFVAGIPVFSTAECERFRETAERFQADHPSDRDWAFDIKCNLLFDWVYANATHPRLLEAVAALLGDDLLLTDSVFRIKEPERARTTDGTRIRRASSSSPRRRSSTWRSPTRRWRTAAWR